MSNRQTPSNDEMEIAESKNPLADLLYDYTAQIMTTRAGNYMYHRIDACLSVVEKTAKWSLPQSPPPSEEDTSKMNISPPPLIRPLPWILFLPALIALRLARVSLSFIALLIGKQPVYPITMVSFLQSRRRKLRALKYRGQKIQRMKRAELESEQGHEQATKTWLDRITFPLRYIICLRAVRPGTSTNQREHHHHRHHQQRQSRDANNDAANDGDESSRAKPRDETASRRKRNAHERDADDSGSSFDASVQELLDKYANDEGDSSYHMSDSASSETDSFISESDKSVTETMDATEENDSKKAKKESNGHVTPPENKPVASQKPQHPKKRSSLNAASNDNSEEKPKSSATAETAAGNGKVDPKDEPRESHTEATQKPKKTTSDAKENIDNKPAVQNNSAKADSSEDSTKHEIQNSKNPSPTATKDMRNNYQQRNTQQQQQPHQKGQQNPHPQQQQTASVNGGGGKKHKRPHHQHSQQHQLQQQHQTQHQPQPQQQQY